MGTPSISRPEFFRPSLDYPRMAYGEMLAQAAGRWPENVAVVFRDASITYRELDALTTRFARALRPAAAWRPA